MWLHVDSDVILVVKYSQHFTASVRLFYLGLGLKVEVRSG